MVVQLKVPVHLNAAVIDGSTFYQSQKQVIDADRFLHLCTTNFADSTLSLGWVIDHGTQRYNWTMIKMMYDLIERYFTLVAANLQVSSNYTRNA